GYVELHELVLDSKKELCWMEAGRWLHLEESMEPGGTWSSHLPLLTYNGLLELRRAFARGIVLLDVAATSLAAMAHTLLEQLIYEGQLKPQHRDDVLRALLLQHKYARIPGGIFKDHPLQWEYNVTNAVDPSVPKPNTALLSLVLMAGTFFLALFLRKFKNKRSGTERR
ncbi:band 3 anion transport protein-like, partial [Meleagris gallopavo]|uniref:band 3 anion transport protein-like n=1 Tax=Meleagris gallopavo TaxID=9103 RepID=UPI00093B4173